MEASQAARLGQYSSPGSPLTRGSPGNGNEWRNGSPNHRSYSPPQKPLPTLAHPSERIGSPPQSPVRINFSSEEEYFQPMSARVGIHSHPTSNTHSRNPSWEMDTPEPERLRDSGPSMPTTQSIPYRQRFTTQVSEATHQPQTAMISSAEDQRSDSPRLYLPNNGQPGSRHTSSGSLADVPEVGEAYPQLQYHHQQFIEGTRPRSTEDRGSRATHRSSNSDSPSSSSAGDHAMTSSQHLAPGLNNFARRSVPRSPSSLSDLAPRGRANSPRLPGSPNLYARDRSTNSGRSPDSRPLSYVDLLNIPYPQAAPAPASFDNTQLRTAVGSNASLLSTKQTLEMYRANVKKTNDPTIQYEFALFMINAAQEAAAELSNNGGTGSERQPSPTPGRDLDSPYVDNATAAETQVQLVREARQILQRLSDRSYPFAQYYLADGYASGLFNKGKEDYDRAFPLFVAASKHGHAEAGYRTALCYEFGWGSRKDPAKAVQYYRQSASKNHPGAMTRLGKACLVGDMGLGHRYREGLKWLKRAAESADFQYNSAPYELGLMHETGYGDDVFQDDSYAAQLFTQAADLGHPEASYRLGDAYEHGKLSCPRDPALSVHFYTGAAQRGHAVAMMALCAWYMVGAEPVLEKDENEAYEWARKSAECGFAKAEYAVGYFSEMGIGCRRDPLDANAWYVKAADQGDERAKHRLQIIRAAASGEAPPSVSESSVPDKSANETTIEGWEIERHRAVLRRAKVLGGFLDGPDGLKVKITQQQFPYDIGIWKNIQQGMGGSSNILSWVWPFSATPSMDSGLDFEVNGFEGQPSVCQISYDHTNANEDESSIWPPPDPDRMPRTLRSFDPRNAFIHSERPLSDQDEMQAFRTRQQEDLKRREHEKSRVRRQQTFQKRYASGQDHKDNTREESEDSGEGEEAWANSEGDRLRDFGVDEETEFYDEDDVPVAELLRMRKEHPALPNSGSSRAKRD
ncbi:MAG: hypothetical protein M1827_004679 [Pycnora praestabilis]|nr:MAG: hypothetical protein M1827_004679 [Pycnora praestabilis]